MAFIFFISGLLAFSVASANGSGSCLESVSDRELIVELERRLAQGGMNPEPALVHAVCDGARLVLQSVGPDGKQYRQSTFTTHSRDCEQYASDINDYRGPHIYQNTLVAACDSTQLMRFMLSSTGVITSLAGQHLTSSARCRERANEINQAQ
jgi:hypothetical protein